MCFSQIMTVCILSTTMIKQSESRMSGIGSNVGEPVTRPENTWVNYYLQTLECYILDDYY